MAKTAPLTPTPKNTVFLLYMEPAPYDTVFLKRFQKAMLDEWGINVYHLAVKPEKRRLEQRPDYVKWKKELGLQDWQTIFIGPPDNDLFNTSRYDAYVYPDQKIGFYKAQYGRNSYLLCHEILHVIGYEHTNGDFNQWSKKVHSYTNVNPPKMTRRRVDVGGGMTIAVTLVPRFTWRSA